MQPTAPQRDARAYSAARIWPLTDAGAGHLEDHVILTSGEQIDRIVLTSEVPEGIRIHDFGDVDLVPGFIDVQVNGGGGVLFNDEPTVEGIRTIVRAHRRFGTTSMLPTFITDSAERMARARAAVHACLEAREPGVLGIHFEGPFLDERKTGAHDRDHVRAPTEADLAIILGESRGITLLTLAAQHLTAAIGARLTEAGVRITLGHCASTAEEAAAAFERGATGVTHLFNAMSPLESRAPGLVGAALASDTVSCGLILDGAHVAFPAAKAAFQALGRERLMLVTDAVQPVGTEMTEFLVGGQKVRLEGVSCINEEGNLAGSALDMATAIRNAVQVLGLGLEEAVWLATRSPANFLGIERQVGSLSAGMRADFTLLDRAQRVTSTVVGGRVSAE
ncbi:N-acetylglucosamine-6-phosphate deacetylase [Planctomycetes bacterium Poly30]|uniref:N-acetylglucosamine-6-phosphate deacetylase n=1 Tax=Saltatorellus ferox TaxID=2528018 RepID=A0A518END1_9BACT|nr:N-acetylglucosamine-6-phosphate deacetylase [Planctomycetes bacterium Poly30]